MPGDEQIAAIRSEAAAEHEHELVALCDYVTSGPSQCGGFRLRCGWITSWNMAVNYLRQIVDGHADWRRGTWTDRPATPGPRAPAG
jgi:hypothetical protein